ncbi:hypothetical protein [Paraburkholderia dipogonis]|jgi:hypothetical protein|uniref:hypothetical protein n=1 Tax=Paraburkholderia dipogonis TaxID=1211383 RepID=UPI0038BB03AF
MYNDIDSPGSALDGQSTRGQMSNLPIPATPPRFGRLAMCVAAASALAIGVMGTVAYSVWFNQDQQAYANAMAGARQALGNGAPARGAVMANTASVPTQPAAAARPNAPQASQSPSTSVANTTLAAAPVATDPEAGGQLASWSGEVKAPTAQPDVVADPAPGTPAPAAMSARRSASAANPPTQQLAAARAGKNARATPQERRGAAETARHKDTLFARMGLFFRRVNYRQHGNANRQDLYSHP